MAKEISHRHLVYDYFKETRSLCAFSLCPDISDRKEYEGLPAHLKAMLIEDGKRANKEPWSVILLSDYLEFSKNGNRVRFEELYFSRRRKLCSLVMAELAENKGTFIADILDGIYLILSESSWCLPAHNSHIRDAKQQEMPDVLHPIIDLFAAETGALLAFAEYLLRPVFREKSSDISEVIESALKERIFTPYETEHFWWMGDGKQPMCNWTPWIIQNVLICALTRPEGYFQEKELTDYLERSAISLDFFLDEYGDDGCCNEGAQYYSHAGLCLFGALYLMSDALKGTGFEEVFKEPLVKNIASYIVRMNVTDNIYINFADCAAICPRRTSREFLFGKLCGDEVLSSFAAADFRKADDGDRILTGEINLFYHVLQALSYEEMMDYPESEMLCEDSFFESTGLMVSRDETYICAAKAGDNADSHNHNDVGSFTIYKKGKPLIIDLGVGTYTRETFSDRRYEIWTMQSQFHNVPTFIKNDTEVKIASLGFDSAGDYYNDGIILQKDGKEFGAKGVLAALEGDSKTGASSLSMDIAGAYKSDEVRRYFRTITHKKGSGVEVLDEYEGSATALLTLMTYEKPEVNVAASGETCIRIGNLGEAVLSGGEVVEIQTYPITDERLKISWKHEVYRVLIKMSDGRISLKIS
ncbi:heparinase II/III domain-containing protein [Butyrivibrio sp. VCB2001]|uniref:heparinase II/III domain-containing protein n=1 Tax=Butyrivibrio sp. VCB2001 TaxID=1280667 RepID=UPI0003F60875|nr:heparinase II/III family protein [Butyrivibrio sp. VCB2001]